LSAAVGTTPPDHVEVDDQLPVACEVIVAAVDTAEPLIVMVLGPPVPVDANVDEQPVVVPTILKVIDDNPLKPVAGNVMVFACCPEQLVAKVPNDDA